jgi:DNA (cytosine-5)-methyltransferase 1
MKLKDDITPSHCFVDLFAGCGGLSLGLEMAGLHPVFVNELNKNALESYLLNRDVIEPKLRDPDFNCQDVKKLVDKERIKKLKKDLKEAYGIDVANGELGLVVGGPPCQGFSGIGHRRSYSVAKEQLPSNHLFQDMAWIVNELRPKIFLFENVKGLLNAKWNSDGENGEIWNDVQKTFKGIKGYKVASSLIHAKNYGVSQNRPRVLLVGVRDDVDLSSWNEMPSGIAEGFLPAPHYSAPDLIDLLGDLVDPSFNNSGSTLHYPASATNDVQHWFRKRIDGTFARKGDSLSEHDYSKHSEKVRAKFIAMIKNNGVIPTEYQTKKFAQRLLPARWGESGPTITATSLPDDYVHFSQPRILTVREWARLQGFPDWYNFSGSRTTGGLRRAGNPREGVFDRELPKYTQIGNAVPVQLAKAVGFHFMKVL